MTKFCLLPRYSTGSPVGARVVPAFDAAVTGKFAWKAIRVIALRFE